MLYEKHKDEIFAPRQNFCYGIDKLQSEICVVDNIILTNEILDKFNNNETAIFVNATEVLAFYRHDILSTIKVPIIGTVYNFIKRH